MFNNLSLRSLYPVIAKPHSPMEMIRRLKQSLKI